MELFIDQKPENLLNDWRQWSHTGTVSHVGAKEEFVEGGCRNDVAGKIPRHTQRSDSNIDCR